MGVFFTVSWFIGVVIIGVGLAIIAGESDRND